MQNSFAKRLFQGEAKKYGTKFLLFSFEDESSEWSKSVNKKHLLKDKTVNKQEKERIFGIDNESQKRQRDKQTGK